MKTSEGVEPRTFRLRDYRTTQLSYSYLNASIGFNRAVRKHPCRGRSCPLVRQNSKRQRNRDCHDQPYTLNRIATP